MKPHQIASLTRSTAVMTCVAALMFAAAGSASARPETLPQPSENGGQQAQTPIPAGQVVGDRPADRVSPIPAGKVVGDTPADRYSPTAASSTSGSSTSTSGDGSDNAPLIVGLSLLTVALLASGTYAVRRHRQVATGH
jgi:hypothetical protein